MNTDARLGLLKLFAGFIVCTGLSTGAQLQVDEAPSPGGGGATTYIVDGSVFTFLGTGSFPPCFVGSMEITACQFLNASEQDWTILEVLIAPGSEPVGCAALFGYDNCASQQGTDMLPSRLIFSGGTGIRVGEILAFKGSGWSSETTFQVSANIPEPGTVSLAVLGIAVLYVLRRRSCLTFAKWRMGVLRH